MAVHWRPLKINIAYHSGEFVRGHPPLFTGIAVKLLSNRGEEVIWLLRRAKILPKPKVGREEAEVLI